MRDDQTAQTIKLCGANEIKAFGVIYPYSIIYD